MCFTLFSVFSRSAVRNNSYSQLSSLSKYSVHVENGISYRMLIVYFLFRAKDEAQRKETIYLIYKFEILFVSSFFFLSTETFRVVN